MFCLNFLPSVGEYRLVTLNVEASVTDLVSIHVFYSQGAQKLIDENWRFSINTSKFNVRTLTDTLSLSIDGRDMTSWKLIADLCMNGYFKTCLNLLKKPLKWLAEEMLQFLQAANLIIHFLLELSILCRWKETYEMEYWGPRKPVSEYSCFLPNWCPEIVWW
jgi:hypothetical protein